MKFIIVFIGLFVLAMCEDECVDSGDDCSGKSGEDCISPDVYEKCAKSCHLCGECADSRPDCNVAKEREECDKIDDRICRKTCGAC